ncbi:hypothetical protein [Aminirod propionatiphilus]|uniref:Uncharacterized protein n=1 Tax=Aminirod propionatiphilus TaxID=3415223 RepID=A0ACD1DX05_9BACT|nr:hypothetical protein KIH16_02435 [Synergistota bacterium]
MTRENFWTEEGLSVDAFYRLCDARLLACYRAMEALFLETPGLDGNLPLLRRGLALRCYCEAACLDCQPLLPLLDIACRRGPTPLTLHCHKKWARHLARLSPDRTFPTLPTLLVVDETGKPLRSLFGRPGGLDVVTWRTGRGWRELFDFLRSASPQTL